tara:strand:+ start:534 stop:791 length:258 start_codon:yes stop_codon:yes gene_type:complete
MDEILQNIVKTAVDSVANEVVETVVEETVATTEVSTQEMAWDVADVLLDTGAAEGIAALFGAPLILVVGLKVIKKWRQKQKKRIS